MKGGAAVPGMDAPIGVFDSGLGGISVLRELVRQLPREDFLYFGDSANAPYGPRSAPEVRALSRAAAARLLGAGCKALVVACNTATAAAISLLRKTWPEVPVVGIEPALKPAAAHREGARVLVLATEMTLREEKFTRLLERYGRGASVSCLAAPGIVEYVERGETEGPAIERYLRELLAPYRDEPLDAVVLGCTHFPFARHAIARALGRPVAFYDGAPGTARETCRRLESRGLLSARPGRGRVELTNSRADMIEPARRLFES